MSTKSPVQDSDRAGSSLAVYGGKIITSLKNNILESKHCYMLI